MAKKQPDATSEDLWYEATGWYGELLISPIHLSGQRLGLMISTDRAENKYLILTHTDAIQWSPRREEIDYGYEIDAVYTIPCDPEQPVGRTGDYGNRLVQAALELVNYLYGYWRDGQQPIDPFELGPISLENGVAVQANPWKRQ